MPRPTPLYLCLIVLLLVTLIISSCSGAPKFTEEELREMVAESIQETMSIDSYTVDMEVGISMNATGEESDSYYIDIEIAGDGSIDTADEEMHILAEMEINADIDGMDIGMDDIEMDIYQVDGWVYMHMDMAGFGDEWTKSRVLADTSEMFSTDMVNQQYDMLKSASNIEYIRQEKVGDSDCYLLKVQISLEDFFNTMGEEGIAGMPMDWEEMIGDEDFQTFLDVLDDIYYNLWIDKHTKYIKQMTADINLDMTSDMFGEPDAEISSIQMDFAIEYLLDNYNEPVNIVLPEEALDAEEEPMGSFPF